MGSYHQRMRIVRSRAVACWMAGTLIGLGAVSLSGQDRTLTPEALRELRQRFPAADTNGDGTLTEAEALAYAARMRPGKGRSSSSSAATVAPAPSYSDVRYGPHGRNVLDFWQAPAAAPTPVVVYFHGGGFVGGDKSGVRRDRIVQECLDAGVSFAAINYRFLAPGVPLQDILRDGARAVQFVRAKAEEWKVDKAQIAAYGGSAGAGISMWIGFHDDLADPASPDPVARESTRLAGVGAIQPQFSYDFLKWRELLGDEAVARFGGIYGAPGNYGLKTAEELRGPAGQKIRADCDMMVLMSSDDPPLFLSSTQPDLALENTGQFLHHPRHAEALHLRAKEIGLPVVAVIPALKVAAPSSGPGNVRDFLLRHVKATPASGP